MADLFQVVGHWGLADKQILHCIIIALGCSSELDSKTLLLKTQHTCIIEHGEMKLILTDLAVFSLLSSFLSAGRFYVCFYWKKQTSIFPGGNALSQNNGWPTQAHPHTGTRVADSHDSNQTLSITSKAHTSRWSPQLDSLSGIIRYQEPINRQAIGTKREPNTIFLFRGQSIEWLLMN